MNAPQQFRFAINRSGRNKDWDFYKLSGDFRDRQGILEDVVDHVRQGHALCAGLLGGKWRSKSNFIGSQWVLSEIDNAGLQRDADGNVVKDANGQGIKIYDHQMTIEEALADPFIQQHCALIYTTPSHRPDWHRFRLVWLLPEFIADIDTYEAMVRLLLDQLPHDPACKDGVRVFYGNTEAEFPLINPSAVLPSDWRLRAIDLAEQAKREQQERAAAIVLKREQFRQIAQDEDWDTDALIQEALSYIPPRTPGSGNYDEVRQVSMGLVDYYGDAEGEIVIERWSPSIKGKKWNVRQKIKSFRRSGIGIGTVFHIAKKYGFKFPERKNQKRWDEPDPAAYDAFLSWEEEQQRVAVAIAKELEPIDLARKKELEQTRRDPARVAAQYRFRVETDKIQIELQTLRIEPTITASGRYIPKGLLQLPEKSGAILIEGVMNIGKTTTALDDLTESHRQRYPSAFRGLFTPRNMLGLQSGRILKLPHHTHHRGYSIPNEVTMCLESSAKLPPDRLPKEPPLLIFDEVSQTIKQILEGETCGSSHAFILKRFRDLLRYVKEQNGWIVLSEDGITNLELDFIQEASGLDVVEFFQFDRTEIVPRDYRVYDAASATWGELKQRLGDSENLVLASDSGTWLRDTERMAIDLGILQEEIWIIDSQSSDQPWAKEFAAEPDKFIAQHQPRLVGFSPSINSGVSINDRAGHFSAMAFHLVHLEPRAAKQLPDRLRSDVPRFGYVKERAAASDSLFSGCRPDLILRDLYRNVKGVEKLTKFAEYAVEKKPVDRDGNALDLVEVMTQIRASESDPDSDYGFYLKYWAKYKARETYGKLTLREDLMAIWRGQGHQIEYVDSSGSRALGEERRAIRSGLDKEESVAFAEVETSQTVSEAIDTLQNLGSTVEQRRSARKRLLEDKLPGCPLNDPDFVLKVVIEQNGKFLKTAELLWLSQNPDAAVLLDRWNWLGAFSKAAKRQEIVWLPKLSYRSAQAKLMNECPLQDFISGKKQRWTNSDAEAQAVHDWMVLRSRQLKRYLRLTVEPHHEPVKSVNKMLRKLGYEVKQAGWLGRGKDSPGERIYAITNLEDVDRDAVLASLSDRFLKRCEEKLEAVGAQPPVLDNSKTGILLCNPAGIAPCPVKTPDTNGDPPDDHWLTPEALDDVRLAFAAVQHRESRLKLMEVIPKCVIDRLGIVA